MFSHIRDSPNPVKLAITDLVISDYSLQYAQRTISKYLDLAKLQSVELLNSVDAATFISALTGHFEQNGGGLQTFKYILAADHGLTSELLGKFFYSFKGLKTICLDDIEEAEAPDPAALKNHSDTLEVFACCTYKSITSLNKETLAMLREHCQKLRQIVIDLPDIELPAKDSAEVQNFEHSILSLLALPDL